jgi:pimeloyl-ACP methyl ester carboxylesterase
MAESVDTMEKMSMPARTPEQIEKAINTGVAEIAYLDEGPQTGTPIILLHGFPDDPKTWDSVIEEIPHENFRLLRPWQRGTGRSRVMDQAAGGAQVAALVQDVLDFADGLDLRRFFLVGHDWSSRVAHGVAALAAERVIGLVALATGYGSGNPSQG